MIRSNTMIRVAPNAVGLEESSALLNGPVLPGAVSVSQDAIDAMFPQAIRERDP